MKFLSYRIYDLPITLKNPSKTGYTFKGWYLSRKSDGKWLYLVDHRYYTNFCENENLSQ